jgi:CRISPR-associated protein Cas2
MLHLIAYDISNAGRLRRVARACEDYGVRIEKSVFECRLDKNLFLVLWSKLEKIVAEDEGDRIIAYPIAESEEKKIMVLGYDIERGKKDVYIF